MIEMTEEQVYGLIENIKNPNELSTAITIQWLHSLIKTSKEQPNED